MRADSIQHNSKNGSMKMQGYPMMEYVGLYQRVRIPNTSCMFIYQIIY